MKRNLCRLLAILILFICFVPATVYANAAEPPSLVIIMKNAPKDASVSLVTEDGALEVYKTQTAWETSYVFHNRDIGAKKETVLKVSGNGTEYEQAIEGKYLNGYNSILTLDFSARTIAEGKLPGRSILLVSLRVLLTLAIESLVFFLFGFRQKRSWLVFLVMNLITQGMLNISLNAGSALGFYMMYKLIFMEFWVFVAEIIGVLAFIKEHGRLRRVSFVLVANLLSLILGGYLISVLPV